MSFENASWTGVQTDFQMAYGGTLPYACTCMPSGKPGKVKTPEESTSFSCIKAWSDGCSNDVVMDGKVAGGGKKIVKGRWLSNYIGVDSYVFNCVQDLRDHRGGRELTRAHRNCSLRSRERQAPSASLCLRARQQR